MDRAKRIPRSREFRATVLVAVRLGKYETGEVLGKGGMSTVYRGQDTLIGREVAIKVLRVPETGDTLDSAARFLSEAKITGLLQHPSIVTIFDYGTTGDNQTYIVMEFVAGRSLGRHIGKLNAEQFARILRGTAQGLDYAHGRGVIHRDIKPSNLLLTPEGDPKILDFGIAVRSDPSAGRITQTGIVVGTPYYLSPEQVSGAALSPAADQFALATVSFEMLTGKTPFAGDTMFQAMTSIVMQAPASVLALNPRLGNACVPVLERALAKKPQERFANCSEFAEELLSALDRSAGWQPFVAGPVAHASAGRWPSGGRVAVAPREPAASAVPDAMATRVDLPMTVGLSMADAGIAPAEFSFTRVVAAGPFFGSGQAHFEAIRKKLDFYQKQLEEEYQTLLRQMRATYVLWLVSVSLAFVVLLAAVVLFLLHQTTNGAVTTASSAMLYFLQRVFQQREDAYRKAAEAKRTTVEYGNQWALVIQTIQAMEDPKERAMREGRLVEAMTDRLRGGGNAGAPRTRRTAVAASS